MKAEHDQDWDDPVTRAEWFGSQREAIQSYLERESLSATELDQEPAWCIPPVLAVWRLGVNGQATGWVIAGDVPTDHVLDPQLTSARQAAEVFGSRWREVAGYMSRGEAHPTIEIGSPAQWPALGDLLRRRAETILEWVGDDDLWQQGRRRAV